MNHQPRDILIVGASLAGLRGAQALRQAGFEGQLTILGSEPEPPYDRPPLSKAFLSGEMEPGALRLPGASGLDVIWRLGEQAVSLDPVKRTVRTDHGEQLSWDRLLIATGARPRRLPGLEPGRPGIHELRTLADARRLGDDLRRSRHLTIIGAGFIGVEVASTARGLGLAVELVTLDPPMPAAGPLVSAFVAGALTEFGVIVHRGRTLHRAVETSDGLRLTLDSGRELDTDLVLSAVGALPAVDWLQDSGLPTRDGVVCDQWCSVVGFPHIAAAGDVARWPHPRYGPEPVRIEHWSNAAERGRVAALTLLHGPGRVRPHAPVPSFWSEHLGLRLQSIGLPALGDSFELVAGRPDDQRFVAVARRKGQLVGAMTYGIPRALIDLRQELSKLPIDPDILYTVVSNGAEHG